MGGSFSPRPTDFETRTLKTDDIEKESSTMWAISPTRRDRHAIRLTVCRATPSAWAPIVAEERAGSGRQRHDERHRRL